jgi:hypothetical protein
MLSYFDNKVVWIIVDALIGYKKSIHDSRERSLFKLNVNARSNNLDNFSYILITHMANCLLSSLKFSV